jgi:hypothetical protein
MANFLALTQKFCRYVGIPGTGPTTVTAQTGELARMVNYVIDAWTDIQSMHQDWEWMRTSTTFTSVDGQGTYTLADLAITDHGRWIPDSFRCYNTAAGQASEIFLGHEDYNTWRDTWQYGATRTTTGQPIVFAITPVKAIGLGPVPSAGYTITGDYYTAPVVLASDSDTPAAPSQFHNVIIYRAMMSYGSYESAPEVYQRGELEYKRIMRLMEQDRLPEVTICGSLA